MYREMFVKRADSFFREGLIREIYATDKFSVCVAAERYILMFHYEFYDSEGNPVGVESDIPHIKRFLVNEKYQKDVINNTLNKRRKEYAYAPLNEENREILRKKRREIDPERAEMIRKIERTIQNDIGDIHYPADTLNELWDVRYCRNLESDFEIKDMEIALLKHTAVHFLMGIVLLASVIVMGSVGVNKWPVLIVAILAMILFTSYNKLNTKYLLKKLHVLFVDFRNEKIERFFVLDMENGKPYLLIHHLEDKNNDESMEYYSLQELSYQQLAAGAWVSTIDGYEEIKEMNEDNWREYLGWQI